MDVIKIRRSVREFIDKDITDEKIDLLLRAGMQAPSAKNQQANCFFVVRKRENLDYLASVLTNATMLKSANAAIIVMINQDKLTKHDMKTDDAASATTNILLEATYLGIGSCWCGMYPDQKRMSDISNILKLNKNYLVFSLIALGYPKDPNALYFIDRYDKNKIFYD